MKEVNTEEGGDTRDKQCQGCSIKPQEIILFYIYSNNTQYVFMHTYTHTIHATTEICVCRKVEHLGLLILTKGTII